MNTFQNELPTLDENSRSGVPVLRIQVNGIDGSVIDVNVKCGCDP